MHTAIQRQSVTGSSFELRLWGAMLCAFGGLAMGAASALTLHLLPVA